MKLKEKQEKILGDRKEQIEEENNEDVCIICRQPGSVQPLHYLSKLKLSNLLGFLLKKEVEPYLVISTCGHKIH